MKKDWYSAAELAGVPGMPSTVAGVAYRAKKEQWVSRRRAGRGGGLEYHQRSLDEVTKTYFTRLATNEARALIAANAPALIEAAPTHLALPEERRTLSDLPDWQRTVVNGRLAVVAAVRELAQSLGERRAVDQFCADLKAGRLPAELVAAVHAGNARAGDGERTVSPATLYRWKKAAEEGALTLAPGVRPPRPQPAWVPMVLALYQRPQKPGIAECLREDWSRAYPGVPAPPERTVQKHIAKLPIEVREWGRMGQAARRAIQPFTRRTTDGLWPMDIVTVDGHLFKRYVPHPLTGRRFRPEVTVYVDYATRRALGWSAWIAESGYATWLALRDTVIHPDWGVMAVHYSDNGVYRSAQHKGLVERLGATPSFAQAYRAQARGLIERFNRSVWVPLAKRGETYCGDDCDPEFLKKALKRADAEGSAVLGTWPDFLDEAREALATYNARPHETLRGKTPDAAWAEAVAAGWTPTVLEAGDLHEILPSWPRDVIRGEVRLPWGRYGAPELRAWTGQSVQVRFNPTDGAQVWVCDLTGRLLCIAERDRNARPVMAEDYLGHARARREQGRVERLERQLESVREEGRGLIEVQAAQPVDLVIHAETVAAIEEAQAAEVVEMKAITDERKLHAYWLRVRERVMACDASVTPGDRRGCLIYWESPEARSMTEFFESFGLTAEDFG